MVTGDYVSPTQKAMYYSHTGFTCHDVTTEVPHVHCSLMLTVSFLLKSIKVLRQHVHFANCSDVNCIICRTLLVILCFHHWVCEFLHAALSLRSLTWFSMTLYWLNFALSVSEAFCSFSDSILFIRSLMWVAAHKQHEHKKVKVCGSGGEKWQSIKVGEVSEQKAMRTKQYGQERNVSEHRPI